MESLKIWTEAAQCMTQRENRQKKQQKTCSSRYFKTFLLDIQHFLLDFTRLDG